MRDRLKKLREAASKAVERARSGPADALKNVTEGMLKRAAASGVPPEMVTAGSAAAAGLWAKVSPDDPLAQARLAEALVRDGRAQEVLEALKLADDDNSEPALLAQSWMARAEALNDDANRSIRRIERVAAMLPSSDTDISSQVRGVLASAALDTYTVDLATRVLGRPADDPLHLVARGRLALVGRRFERAIELLERAARSSLEEAVAWHGIALATAGQPRQATSILNMLRTRGPERLWVDVTRGWLLVLEGKPEAKTLIESCLERGPHHPAVHFLLGVIAEREEDFGTAQKAFVKSAKSAPAWADPWLGVVRTAMATGDYAGARAAAQQAGTLPEYQLLTGLAVGLSGDADGAEAIWEPSDVASKDRETQRDIAMLRGSVAWRLTADSKPEAAASAWRKVASHASRAGSSRVSLSRWAIDAARRCLDETQPHYYVVEAALGAASALRPESEDLVVSHCSASFLARGPAAARSALEAALARGASDERITGLLGLIDAATRGGPVPAPALAHASLALKAASKARDGDSSGCLELLDEAMDGKTLTPAMKAVLKGARALVELARFGPLLRKGEIESAAELLGAALDHLPPSLERDRVVHDLAAVCTIAARRSDSKERETGEVPTQQTVVWWQEALGYWAALGAAPAYWADLSKRVMELDDPRLSARDVDALRASIYEVALELPATLAREALASGHRRRARTFVALIIGAPVPEESRRMALEASLSPLTDDAHEIAEKHKKEALEIPQGELTKAYRKVHDRIAEIREELSEAAPDSVGPVIDALDELALCLVSYFENLHDRAGNHKDAMAALSAAADLAASDTLKAELEGKLKRMKGKR